MPADRTVAPASALSPKQRSAFERDGYLSPVPALRDDEVAHHLARYNAYCDRHREKLASLAPSQKFRVFSETHFVMPWVHEIVTHPRVLDAVESLLGPNLLAWNSNWFSKMPGEKTFVSWHQDGTYWNLTPPNVVTAWVALTKCDATNGCMRVIPATHTRPALPQRETYNPDNALSRGQEIAATVDEAQAVDLCLEPGEMSLHHIWIVHGSNANTGTRPRIGLAIRYVRPEVVQDSPAKPMAILVRGRDEHGNFELLPPPTEEISPQVQDERQAAIVDRIRAGILKK